MTIDDKLLNVLAEKNALPAPELNVIVPEVRTMMKFISVPQAIIDAELATRPGSFAVVVSWYFRSVDDGKFVSLLSQIEPRLAQTNRAGITYLGTYRKFISEIDRNAGFMTQWGLDSLVQLGEIGIFADKTIHGDFQDFISLVDFSTLSQTIYSLAVVS